MMMDIFVELLDKYQLISAFFIISLIMAVSSLISKLLKEERMASAISIILGLVLAYIGGRITGGSKGLADLACFSGLGLLGGGIFRDFAIISTAYGVDLKNLKDAGLAGVISLFIGVFWAFILGVIIAYGFGYRDPIDLTTLGAGAVTFIVGPVTGTALGADSNIIALSIATGVIKSILTMVATPFLAKKIGLDNPTSAMVFGGLMGTTSGVAGGLAGTDKALVPYGAMTATFYTGLGSLLIPSVGYFLVRTFF